jgi:hypothetical protein
MVKNVALTEEGSVLDSIRLTGRQLLSNAAEAWRLPPRAVMVIVLIPFAIAILGALTALLGKDAYKWFTREDGFAETVQVLVYSISLVLSLIVAVRQWRAGERLIALLFLGLSLALFFMVGEELSWGQRVFGWETTSGLASVNKQEETNLHNIYGVGSTFKWVQLLVGAYGTILPLAVLFWRPPERYRQVADAIIPHYSLVTYFAPMFLWRIYRNLLEAPEQFYFVVAEYNEVVELILSLGFLLFVVFQLRRLSARAKEHSRGRPLASTSA